MACLTNIHGISQETANCECNHVEWQWTNTETASFVELCPAKRRVLFHLVVSTGTAAVRGDTPMVANHHYYWEIHIVSELYGTDVMIGVATENASLSARRDEYLSMLGADEESWGFSYTGRLQHAGRSRRYSPGYMRGVTIGVYLDMWSGTLEFYADRKPLGIAYRGLKSRGPLFPVVCSTAAQSSMELLRAASLPASLVLSCMRHLATRPPTLQLAAQVPGLRCLLQRAFWLLLPSQSMSFEYDDDDPYDWEMRGRNVFRHCNKLSEATLLKNEPQNLSNNATLNSYLRTSDSLSSMDCNGSPPLELKERTDSDVSKMLYDDINSDEEDNDEDDAWGCGKLLEAQEPWPAEQSISLVVGHRAAACKECAAVSAVTIRNPTLLGETSGCLQCFRTS